MARQSYRALIVREGTRTAPRIFAVLALSLGPFARLPSTAAEPPARDADELFKREQWTEAREAYDTAAKGVDRQSRQFREATRGAILASLKLKDWSGALDRTETLLPASVAPEKAKRFFWESNLSSDEEWQADLTRLESMRDLFGRIGVETTAAPDDVLDRLAALQISLDERLVRHLDPPHEGRFWGWEDALPSVNWWWENVYEAQDYINSDERYARWHWRVGVALGQDGQPIFLATPPQYSADLPRSKKLLFLLEEIEKLDRTPQCNAAAAAVLARARLMRRLYGPQTDVGWSSGEFYYRYDKRPSFVSRTPTPGVKETWELADNEARTNIAEQSRVIVLPDSHSPLALLEKLERVYPQSESVPAAIHERAQYYQSRRQFTKAIDEYQREIKQFPDSPLVGKARTQIARIEHADVLLGKTGIYASGTRPKLWFACRNAANVDFTAFRFDFEAWMKSGDGENLRMLRYGWAPFHHHFGDRDEQQLKELAKFVGPEVSKWSEQVEKTDRVASHSTAAPLIDAGTYLVEARARGSDQRSRGLVVVSGIAIVQRPLIERVLLWVVDPSTGKPLAGQEVRVNEHWSNHGPDRAVTLTADERGIIEYRPDNAPHGHFEGLLTASAKGRGLTFCELADPAYDRRGEQSLHVVTLTDRPVYRPGSTINFRIWARDLIDRTYLPARAGVKLQIAVHGPGYNNTVRTLALVTDELGSVASSFVIGSEARLGEYSFFVETPGHDYASQAGTFRVEEYKAPEFDVTVVPAKSIRRPGEPVSARVEARYYFGAPVPGGEVRYEIFREEMKEPSATPAEFDWLYGAGYGVRSSAAPTEDDEDAFSWRRWWYYSPWDQPAPRQRVAEGSTRLNADGQADMQFDPGADGSTPDRDWRYIIEAEVRDEGRRTVVGTGSVLAPRQEFRAVVQLDRGWYRPGDKVSVEINARLANNVPVVCDGRAVLSCLTEQTPDGPLEIERIAEWEVNTDADGRCTLAPTAPVAGRYRLEMQSRDTWDREVGAAVDFWVHDDMADFSHSPRPALEIVPDQPTYRPGDTARLLVVTASVDPLVLICRGQDDARLIRATRYAQLLEVPIEEKDVPNLFIEGTVVRDGAVHTKVCQLFVPPVREILKVEVKADKAVQRPGEPGRFQIKVLDVNGQPVRGDLALTTFDKAVAYIQPESATGPKAFIRARKARRSQWIDDVLFNLNRRRFDTSGSFLCPEYHIVDDYVPQIGAMGGAPPQGGDPGDAKEGTIDAEGRSGLAVTSMVAPKVRADFSDTALWHANLRLDENGSADATVRFPESLTTWRMRGYVVTKDTHVGDLAYDVVTSKDLLVRLQRPRFLVERDEVVLSANVHNRLKNDKDVTVELLVPAAVFRAEGADKVDAEGNLRLTAHAQVPTGGQHRFDWTLTIVDDGLATVTVSALTDEESDAMRTAMPVRVHGSPVTVAQTGAFRPADQSEKALVFDIPEDADLRKTQVSISLSPGPAGAAFEAIPYLAGYPYGCVEQSMSRFYPTVLAARTIKELGIDIARLADRLRGDRRAPFGDPPQAAAFDAAELQRMTEAGLQRLERFQHADGGWGWWEHDQSSPYMTAYVLHGLHIAAENGAAVKEQEYEAGLQFLARVAAPNRPVAAGNARAGRHTDMFVTYVLALDRPSGFRQQGDNERQEIANLVAKRLEAAFAGRDRLPLYDRLLLALAYHGRAPNDRPGTVLNEVLNSVETDAGQDLAHLPVRSRSHWHSWNSEVETNAWLLRALVAIDADNPLVPKVAHWLAVNRKHGRFWHSTQDTALAVTALSEYLVESGTNAGEQTVRLRLDDGPAVTLPIDRGDVLGVERELRPTDKLLQPGRHQLTIERTGGGALHYGLHAQVTRTVALGETQGAGMTISRRYLKQGRPLSMDETITSGDILDVELLIKSDDDYEYLAFEDFKPAGCEPVQVRSGHTFGDGLWANVELRDDRVVFFTGYLTKGVHALRYKLRAENPGRFHVLPAQGFAMYAPEIHAQSDEFRLRVK